jgi:hypothetical protein
LAAEAAKLEVRGLLAAHTFEFNTGTGTATFEHPGRAYVDLDPERIPSAVADAAPLLARFASVEASRLLSCLAASLPDLQLAAIPQVKLQVTRGERGCAPCHFDTSESAPTRQLTILIYLSEHWDSRCGGELEIRPLLSAPVKLEPLFDRAVLFLSDRLLHRSLPPRDEGVRQPRWLLTVWFDGLEVDKHVGHGLAPPMQRLLAPALHHEAYLEALTQSLPPGEAREALIAAQRAEISELESDGQLVELLEAFRELAESEVSEGPSEGPEARPYKRPCPA